MATTTTHEATLTDGELEVVEVTLDADGDLVTSETVAHLGHVAPDTSADLDVEVGRKVAEAGYTLGARQDRGDALGWDLL